MSNRLRAYVRRYILTQAREYAAGNRRTKESTETAFMAAMRGTDTGWWHGLIYTADILDMFNWHRNEVREVIREYLDATGCALGDTCQPGPDALTYADLIAATGKRHSFDDYRAEGGRGKDAIAAVYALRFAVEYLAGEIARDYCPDL